MPEKTQLALCPYMRTICHPLLSDIFAGAFAGETLDTCATSLAKISPHVLNLSPVNKLERQNCASEVTSERDH